MSVYEKNPNDAARACIIWMHGLGSDAQNMMGIADAFPSTTAIKHVFIDAPIRPVAINNNIPMRAWYNIMGVKLTDREDKAGILESYQIIQNTIDTQIQKGFQHKQIYLAGFSQGGAMALYAGLKNSDAIGGIISLSAYLPLVSDFSIIKNTNTPIFIALGEHDQVVQPAWTNASFKWLQDQGFTNLVLKKYPMEHSICIEEIRDLYNWITAQISNVITENSK